MAVGLCEGPSYPGHSPYTNHFFAVLPSERPQKGSAQPLWNRSTVFSLLLFSCSSSHSSPLAHLHFFPPYDLVIWTDSFVPFPFGKGGSDFVALRPPFSFRQAQRSQVFPLKTAPFCKLSAGIGSTNSVPLLFSSCVTLALSSSSFLISHSPWHIWQELSSLSPCIIRLQSIPEHSFLPWTTRQMSATRAFCNPL